MGKEAEYRVKVPALGVRQQYPAIFELTREVVSRKPRLCSRWARAARSPCAKAFLPTAKWPKGDVVLVRHKPSRRYRLYRCARDFYAWVACRPRIYTLGQYT
jgi:hypothetical protein